MYLVECLKWTIEIICNLRVYLESITRYEISLSKINDVVEIKFMLEMIMTFPKNDIL